MADWGNGFVLRDLMNGDDEHQYPGFPNPATFTRYGEKCLYKIDEAIEFWNRHLPRLYLVDDDFLRLLD